ncbi:MAG: tyrosine-type recombinase/integrase [Motiliproteus sp.]
MAMVVTGRRISLSDEEKKAIGDYSAYSDQQANAAIAFLSGIPPLSRQVAVSHLRWALRIAGLTGSEWSKVQAYRHKVGGAQPAVDYVVRARSFWGGVPLRLNLLTMDWSRIDRDFVLLVKEILRGDLAMSTSYANGSIWTMKHVVTQEWEWERISTRQYHQVMLVESSTTWSKPKDRQLGIDDVSTLLAAAQDQGGFKALRDTALISLLYACGLQRSEAAALNIDDIDPQRKRIRIRGETNQQRWGYPPLPVWNWLQDWTRHGLLGEEAIERTTIKGFSMNTPAADQNTPLFVRIRRWDVVLNDQRLTTSGIQLICTYLSRLAGIEKITPNDLRAAFIRRMIIECNDLSLVKNIVGHKSINTTAGYDQRTEEARSNVFRDFTMHGLS